MILSVDLVPTFGLISDIIILDVDDYYLVCEPLHTECFRSHYHAYEVSKNTTTSCVFVKQTHLANHCVLGLYHHNFTDFVVLKYHLSENV